MEPNTNFDTTAEATVTPMVERRVINISQSEVASFLGMGWKREQIADYYGITSKEMYGYMCEFGFYKARTPEAPDYTVNLVFDAPAAPTRPVANITVKTEA